MLLLSLSACLIFIPLSSEASYYQVALFKELNWKLKIQMHALLIVTAFNFTMLSFMDEGTATLSIWKRYESGGARTIPHCERAHLHRHTHHQNDQTQEPGVDDRGGRHV